MNSTTQVLKKQNEQLRRQVAFMGALLDSMAADHELLGSVACGFAWDLEASAIEADWPLVLWEQSEKDYQNRATQLSQELRAD